MRYTGQDNESKLKWCAGSARTGRMALVLLDGKGVPRLHETSIEQKKQNTERKDRRTKEPGKKKDCVLGSQRNCDDKS